MEVRKSVFEDEFSDDQFVLTDFTCDSALQLNSVAAVHVSQKTKDLEIVISQIKILLFYWEKKEH